MGTRWTPGRPAPAGAAPLEMSTVDQASQSVDAGAVYLSIVIPAYNEVRRLPPYLIAIRSYCDRVLPNRYEVVVVDDGSKDNLVDILADLRAGGWSELSWVRHTPNQGKGAAMRTGLRVARGELILLADADGATAIEEEAQLRRAMEQGGDIAIGSRLLPDPKAKVQREHYRALPGRFFALLTRVLFGLPVRDTQCGFKMFGRAAAQRLGPVCHETGYLFDLEALIWAHRLGLRIVEVPVTWQEIPGSKVRLVRDGWRMFRGLFRLWQNIPRM